MNTTMIATAIAEQQSVDPTTVDLESLGDAAIKALQRNKQPPSAADHLKPLPAPEPTPADVAQLARDADRAAKLEAFLNRPLPKPAPKIQPNRAYPPFATKPLPRPATPPAPKSPPVQRSVPAKPAHAHKLGINALLFHVFRWALIGTWLITIYQMVVK